jgi:hypothetical protein
MATNLTNYAINVTFGQLVHIDGGPEAAEKTLFSGIGVATALKIGTVSVSVGNIRFSGNTISSLNTNGNINLTPAGTGLVRITNVSFTDQAAARTALALGTMATQNTDAVAITGGTISNVVFTGSFIGITSIESDKFSTKDSTDGISISLNDIYAEGASANIDIDITPKGTGEVNITKVDIDAGAIDGTTLGAAVPASVKGTTVEATTSIGYPVGTGGVVTQLTSKSTGVTLNKISGRITMNNAVLNRNLGVSFIMTNSFITTTDVVVANIAAGATPTAYALNVTVISAGSCSIHLHNLLNGTDLSEAVEINFIVLKGAHS